MEHELKKKKKTDFKKQEICRQFNAGKLHFVFITKHQTATTTTGHTKRVI